VQASKLAVLSPNKQTQEATVRTHTYVHTNSSLDPDKKKTEIRAATVRITLLRPTSHGRIVLAAIG